MLIIMKRTVPRDQPSSRLILQCISGRIDHALEELKAGSKCSLSDAASLVIIEDDLFALLEECNEYQEADTRLSSELIQSLELRLATVLEELMILLSREKRSKLKLFKEHAEMWAVTSGNKGACLRS